MSATTYPSACHRAAGMSPDTRHDLAAAVVIGKVAELLDAGGYKLNAAALREIGTELATLAKADRATESARDYLATMAHEFDQRAHQQRMMSDESLRVAANATERRDSDTARANHLRHAADHDREMTGAIGRREAYRDALRVLDID